MASSGVTTINGPVSDSAAVTAALWIWPSPSFGQAIPALPWPPAASGTGAQMK